MHFCEHEARAIAIILGAAATTWALVGRPCLCWLKNKFKRGRVA